MIWKDIYDRWLKEGDLKVLMYLSKVQRYLEHGRTKTHQEQINLIAQINALLDLNYHGDYQHLTDEERVDKDIVAHIMRPNQRIVIPSRDDSVALQEFLVNDKHVRIKPQPVDLFRTHPLWILWGTLVTDSDLHRTALWMYRKVFISYIQYQDYKSAVKIYQHASCIKIRTEPLPLLNSYILRQIMYANLDSTT